MTAVEEIEKYKEKLKQVRIQRNNYEVLLREVEKKLSAFKTPIYTKAHGHIFKRYLMSNEFAEEMKCECGYTIWPCRTQQDVTNAMIATEGKVIKCNHYPQILTKKHS